MERREALRRTAMLMGGALSAPAVMGILNGCKAKPSLEWQPVFLTEDEARLVAEVAEIIIPRTDTPGAKDVGVTGFIDTMLNEVYPEADQKRFLEGLKQFDIAAVQAHGDHFIDLDPAKQVEFVNQVHSQTVGNRARNGETPFIVTVRELTLLGFFTSEPGATQVLRYEAVPGVYHGCLPLAEVGKTWAT